MPQIADAYHDEAPLPPPPHRRKVSGRRATAPDGSNSGNYAFTADVVQPAVAVGGSSVGGLLSIAFRRTVAAPVWLTTGFRVAVAVCGSVLRFVDIRACPPVGGRPSGHYL